MDEAGLFSLSDQFKRLSDCGDATLVAAPKQRNTATEKKAIKAGKSAAEI
jgi:hypothetical protein